MKTRSIVLSVLVSLALVAGVSAQTNYPTKPIQIVVPAGAGGDTDLNSRLVAKYLEKELGQPVIIVNVNGAGGSLGTRKVKDSDPDGYNVLFFHPSMYLNKIMGLVDYNFRDFENAGIAVMDTTNIFVVSASSPYKTLADVVKASKTKPRSVKYATETGGLTHVQGLAFQEAAGIEMNIVDVGSAAQKIVALLGRQVDVIGISYGIIKDYVKSGKFRVIGVLADERNAQFPEVPTFKESGFDMSFPKFFYYLFPKGTPQAIVTKFTKAVEKVTKDPALRTELNKFMVEPYYMAPSAANEYMGKAEAFYEKFKVLLTTSKVEKEEVKKE